MQNWVNVKYTPICPFNMKPFGKCPIQPVPEGSRLKKKEVGICRGGCNSLTKILNTTYQLCRECVDRQRYFGYECDACSTHFDGTVRGSYTQEKVLCNACKLAWKSMDFCDYEKFYEVRQGWLNRPQSFVKAEEAGVITKIPEEEQIDWKNPIAQCNGCHREGMKLKNIKYNLCANCVLKFQYYGESCSIGGTEPCEEAATYWDTTESRFVCEKCQKKKRTYKLTSYRIYETQIRTITECNICSATVSHNSLNGKNATACIDHDHDTGRVRGVLCHTCNHTEGLIKKLGGCPKEWAKNLLSYLENPPLNKPWTQLDI